LSTVGGRIVLEFARAPVPGRVKTRLAAGVGAREAARIYRRLAEGVHGALLAAQSGGILEVALAPAEPWDAAAVSAWLAGARHVWPQPEGDLGARLRGLFARAFASGAERAAAVGTDLVGLAPEDLARAFERLDGADVALAPTADGGYGLLALRRPAPTLFEGIPWGTSTVADATRARARAAGLSLVELPVLREVDRAEDLDGAVPLLSVLVPVLDEAERLPRLLADLPPASDLEVVVADGGSRDGSAEIALRAGARVVRSRRGRGRQLGAAARAARGRWYWTLHADARLEPGATEAVLDFCRAGRARWAFSRARIDGDAAGLRLVEFGNFLRARFLKTPYGDQGILVCALAYEEAGGYPPVALMEDLLLARRLARRGPPALLPVTVLVDPRRWERRGVLGALRANLGTLLSFLLRGEDPEELARRYEAGVRSTHGS
jgi:hypothetical protein